MRLLTLLLLLPLTAITLSCSGVPPTPKPSSRAVSSPVVKQTTTPVTTEPTPTKIVPPAITVTTPTASPPVEPSATPAPQSPTDLMNEDPAQVDNSNMPITPIEGLGVTGNPPEVDIATWSLSVDGLVNTPLALDYKALLELPTVTQTVLLICPGFFADNAEWTGVPMYALLAQAGVRPGATQVVVHAMDTYNETFDLADMEREGVFLAYMVDGQTLPKEHGYPVRLVLKGKYGALWVKWVNRIEVK